MAELPCAHPGNGAAEPAGVVLPSTVASAIKTALAGGWHPALPGPAYKMTLDEAAVTLVG
ncbi:hypothetical protein ACFHW2_23725 [Actinomadura sp. LOL_016]|uniref:hypothetical protein n=1 Tax=unclassified Actinomadura TaxID=2626254 RepID=UPI003A81260E